MYCPLHFGSDPMARGVTRSVLASFGSRCPCFLNIANNSFKDLCVILFFVDHCLKLSSKSGKSNSASSFRTSFSESEDTYSTSVSKSDSSVVKLSVAELILSKLLVGSAWLLCIPQADLLVTDLWLSWSSSVSECSNRSISAFLFRHTFR